MEYKNEILRENQENEKGQEYEDEEGNKCPKKYNIIQKHGV